MHHVGNHLAKIGAGRIPSGSGENSAMNQRMRSQRRETMEPPFPALRVIRPEEMDSPVSVQHDAQLEGGELEGAAAANPPLHATAELLAEFAEVSDSLESSTPQDILKWAIARFGRSFTMATAFGPEGMCLIHMLSEIDRQVPIFNLETGYQFAETHALREEVKVRYGIEVEYKYPETTVEQYEAANGGPVYKTDPNRCCAERKLSVLKRAARGYQAWASAIRRDQSTDRARAAIVGWDTKFNLAKVSPLANWTKKDVWAFIVENNVPYNPLHDKGYPSVGCWPCTRSIMAGEDERAGRWSGFAKTECGLHTQ